MQIFASLAHCERPRDAFWRAADRLLKFPEAQSLCIGYARGGTAGSGSGKGIRAEVLDTALQILKAGRRDPAIFEIVGLFQPKVGPDRISDMTAGIIIDDLKRYTRRVLAELSVQPQSRPSLAWSEGLPLNPFNGKQIVLAPLAILDDLPLALNPETYISTVKDPGAARERLNATIMDAWKQSLNKAYLRKEVLSAPELVDEMLRRYRDGRAEPYDFDRDPMGHRCAHRHGKEIAEKFPLALANEQVQSVEDVERIASTICDHFKTVIENNGVWRMLYDNQGQPLHEKHAQLAFFTLADTYCRNANIDLSREVNSGRGAIDFKMSKGYNSRVLIEIKLTTNQQLNHGYEKQIREYAKAEKTERTIYLVIEVEGTPRERLERFDALVRSAETRYPRIWRVDGRHKSSASKIS